MRQQVEDGAPVPEHLGDRGKLNAAEPDPVDENLQGLRRPAIGSAQSDDLRDVDALTEERPPPGGNQSAHRVRHQDHAPSLRPPAQFPVQGYCGLLHRLAEVVGEGQQRGVRSDQFRPRCGHLGLGQPEFLRQGGHEVLVAGHQLLEHHGVGADEPGRAQTVADLKRLRISDPGHHAGRIHVVHHAAVIVSKSASADSGDDDDQGKGAGHRGLLIGIFTPECVASRYLSPE